MAIRILAVDPGEKRIGLALSDPTASLASPLTVLSHRSRPQDAAAITRIAAENHAALIIVGQTFDMDGKPDLSGRRAARLAAAIRAQSDLPVELWDESGSTRRARNSRIQTGVKRSKRSGHLDDHAAAVILQSYLDDHREELNP